MNDDMNQQNANEHAEPETTGAGNTTSTPNTAATGADNQKLMGILSYIGPLVIIPFLMAKEDPFVKFHIKQGLLLLIISVGVWFVTMAMPFFWMFLNLINLGVFILAVIGIINVVQHEQKELPLVGSFASYFKF